MFDFFKNMKADAQAAAIKGFLKNILTDKNISEGLANVHRQQNEMETEAGGPLMATLYREGQTGIYVAGIYVATPEGQRLWRKHQIGTVADISALLTSFLATEEKPAEKIENGNPELYRPAGNIPAATAGDQSAAAEQHTPARTIDLTAAGAAAE